LTAGSIPEPQIEQTLIELRAFGETMGLPAARLELILGKARKDLFAGEDERPGPPDPLPTP